MRIERVALLALAAVLLPGCVTQRLWDFGSGSPETRTIEAWPEYGDTGVLHLTVARDELPAGIDRRLPARGHWVKVYFSTPEGAAILPPELLPGGELGAYDLSVALEFDPSEFGPGAGISPIPLLVVSPSKPGGTWATTWRVMLTPVTLALDATSVLLISVDALGPEAAECLIELGFHALHH